MHNVKCIDLHFIIERESKEGGDKMHSYTLNSSMK